MTYTCTDYRFEMQLLALQRRLLNEDLNPDEKETLKGQIRELERQMGLDHKESLLNREYVEGKLAPWITAHRDKLKQITPICLKKIN